MKGSADGRYEGAAPDQAPTGDESSAQALRAEGGTFDVAGCGLRAVASDRQRLEATGLSTELGREYLVCGGRVRLDAVTPDAAMGRLWLTFCQLDRDRRMMTISASTWIDLALAEGVCDA